MSIGMKSRLARRRLVLVIAALASVSFAAFAAPAKPQCWSCLERLAMELPEVNPYEDPMYEQELPSASVLPALSNCSLDEGEISDLRQIIQIFTDAAVSRGGVSYVRDKLEHMPQVDAEDRAKLLDGAEKDLETTLRHLVDHNCRILLKSHFDEGASRQWILRMIALGHDAEAGELDDRRRSTNH